jgi:DNA/RNA-binding domain of Phe-tRNA-synthetase-like protein
MDIFKNEAGGAAKFSIGLLIIENVKNNADCNTLKVVRDELEDTIRAKYAQSSRNDLKAQRPMDAYIAYYKKFGYTYHVLSQLESVIKGKPIPTGLPAVEAMFMAELKNMILTAGHDLDQIQLPISLRISTGKEGYTTMSGKSVETIPKDFMIADQNGILSSILRGPDLRTAITKHTTRVIYMVYAPPGVEEQLVYNHLGDIESYVHMTSQASVTRLNTVY